MTNPPGPVAAQKFADHDGVRIRYLDNEAPVGTGAPVLFIPGIVDFADDYTDAFGCFGDRRLLVVEMRGRGGSDAPVDGYSPEEQAGDVTAVLAAEGVTRYHLMTFSRGTTPALELALRSPGAVVTVSIGDYLPAEVSLGPGFVESMWNSRWRGQPVSSRVPRHVLEGIQAASRPREMWSDLAELAVPVLVARGSEGGIIDEERARRYRESVPGLEVVTIPGAGHDLFRPSRTAYPEAVLDFISRRAPGT